ncbi:MAG: hypothetical protein IJY63_00780 [Clostridia bacterium]|nr:hypothetical protein [Clostridia bacterium]
MIKDFLKEKQNTKKFHAAVCGLLFLIAALEFLPLLFSNLQSGHDLKYHYGVIRSLSAAWDKGNFFSKVMELIGGDYGYGTGLFYSTIPGGLCVILMKTLGLSMIGSIYVELVLLFAAGGIVVYSFLRRVFGDGRTAAIGAVTYILFPYFLWDVYVRFAFSEIFLLLSIPMIAWSVYELFYRKNYAVFFALFVLGFALSIFLHLTMTVYIALFLAVWLLVHFKQTFTKKNLAALAGAAAIAVLLSATYLLPMFSNYAVTETEKMGRSAKTLFYNSLGGFGNFYLLTGFAYVSLVGMVYAINYFRTEKEKRVKDRLSLIVLWGLLLGMYSPFFPWGALPKVMGMIQYPFRLMIIGGILISLQVATLANGKLCGDVLTKSKTGNSDFKTKNTLGETLAIHKNNVCKDKKWQKIAVWFCGLLCVANVIGMPFSLFRRVLSTTDVNSPMAQVSGFEEFNGLGVRKNGDYFPKGCTSEYVASRLNSSLISNTDVRNYELADYDALQQLSFVAEKGGYAVLDIPYALFDGVALYRFEKAYTNARLPITAESYDGGAQTKLIFPTYDKESKIILYYKDAPLFKAYLLENAFGVLVLSGDVTATNLQKEHAGKYSVDVTAGADGGVLELPSYYYKGYRLTLATGNGRRVSITPMHGRNGFLEAEITESGTLYVEYFVPYLTMANALTAVGAITLGSVVVGLVLWQKKKKDE